MFDQILAMVIKTEGGLTTNPADPGNWTTGCVGKGTCRGTKYGIAAASYPNVDIPALTLEQAGAIYRRDFWDPIGGDHLPPALALLMFDAAINSGVRRAVQWLQAALGVAADGTLGPVTMTALQTRRGQGADLCAELLAQRILFDASLPTWPVFGRGWARRLAALPYQSLSLEV